MDGNGRSELVPDIEIFKDVGLPWMSSSDDTRSSTTMTMAGVGLLTAGKYGPSARARRNNLTMSVSNVTQTVSVETITITAALNREHHVPLTF